MLSVGSGEPHSHKWRVQAHSDHCHFFQWHYVCDCGATLSTEDERDFASGWLGTGDFPMPESCERCRELQAGAERKEPTETITEATT